MIERTTEPESVTVRTLILDAVERLDRLATARLDAEVLLALTLRRTRTWLHTWPDKAVTLTDAGRYLALIARRAGGVPLAYLTGEREFWSLSLTVNAHTLIPRPDTELLVELALSHIESGDRIIDLGTGSGAIALALASTRPDTQIIATDLSFEALRVARANARRLSAQLTLVHSDWLAGFGDRCARIIVSNPPYIAVDDPHLQDDGVSHEPGLALTAGVDGLTAIREIIPAAARCLKSGGKLFLEHGYKQASDVRALLDQQAFDSISTVTDAQEHDRVTFARRL